MRRFPLSQLVLPAIALAVGLVSSLLAWRLTMELVARQKAERFDFRVREWTGAISHAIDNQEHLLYGAAALFDASEDVTRDEWRAYTAALRQGQPVARGQAFGFARRLAPEEVEAHCQQVRDTGVPSYAVWPEGERSEYVPCVYLEPLEAGRQGDLGFDLASEPVRQAALERARDTGRATLSGKVNLAREDDTDERPGLVMVAPVYHAGRPTGTVSERRGALYGYVFSSFSASDFLGGLFSAGLSFTHLQVFDGREATAASLLLDGLRQNGSRPAVARDVSHEAAVTLAGRTWTLRFAALPGFGSQADLSLPWVVLAGGFTLSIFFGLIVWTEQRIRAKARQLQRSESQLAATLSGIRSLNENLEQRVRERTAELARATADWERTFDAVPDMIAIISDDLQIVRANRALAARLGLTPRDLVGRRCYACVHGTREPPALCPHQRLMQDGQPHVLEMVVPQLGGFMEIQDTPLRDEAGRLVGTVHVIRDVNQRELARQALQEANASLDRRVKERTRDLEIARAEAEAASRAKSEFLSSMSLEIRTPMNAILGFAQILERDPALTARQAEQVKIITRSGRHLLLLINDILDMSRIESGQLSLSLTDFSLHDLLTDLEMMFRPRALAKGLQFIVEWQEDLARYVTTDEGKLRQILVNLIGNAIKFTESGGVAVRIRTAAAAEVPAPASGQELLLLAELEDTGPGIPEQDKTLIFEPFRQGEAGKKAGGTGLGLAISKRLAEMLGGSITVQSTVGKGSCFRVQVPVKRAGGVTEKPDGSSRRVVGLQPGTGPVRVVVADDQKNNRDLLRALLEPVGFEIREAANGQEALDLFACWRPHAVLMDMRMPVLDGYEATRRIKATDTGRTTPVIAVTASAFEESKQEVVATGADGYLRKPFRPEELFSMLETALHLRYVFAETAETRHDSVGVRTLTREDLAALPEELVHDMWRAVELGDMARLKELIACVIPVDIEVARALLSLAGAYDYEKLERLVAPQGGL